MTRNVGIYLFDEIEVLDLGGPFEVFSTSCSKSLPSLKHCVPPALVVG